MKPHSIGFVILNDAKANSRVPPFLENRAGRRTYRQAAVDGSVDLDLYRRPDGVETFIALDVRETEKNSLEADAVDGKIYRNWVEFTQVLRTRGWDAPGRPRNYNSRRYYLLTPAAWNSSVPAALVNRLGWTDDQSSQVVPTFSEAYHRTLAGVIKPSGLNMIAIFEGPTLAEETAMEAIATGGRGYSRD